MVNEIAEGVLLLNQFDGKFTVDNETQQLNGTYLVKFHNTSVTVNNKIFISKDKSTVQVLPAILQPTPQESKFEEILAMSPMKDIHINNTKQIEVLQSEKTIHQITSYSTLSLLILIVIVFVILKNKGPNTIKIIDTGKIKNPEVTTNIIPQHKLGESEMVPVSVTGSKERPIVVVPRRSFYETPFF